MKRNPWAERYGHGDVTSRNFSMKTKLILSAVVAGSLGVVWMANGVEKPGAPPAPAAAIPPELPAVQEGYFVLDGAAYVLRDGKVSRLMKEVSLRVTPGGILGFDGTPITLPAGKMLTNDGSHVRIPAGITPKGPVPVEPGATDPATTPPPPEPVKPDNAKKPDLIAPPVENREPVRVPSPGGVVPGVPPQ
jgi:hypothetical protein